MGIETEIARPDWQKLVAPYARADLRSGIWQMVNSVLPFLALWPLMFWAYRISWWLVLPLALLAAGFWVRTFIIFHDCCHGSFFKSRTANEVTGILLGILTLHAVLSMASRSRRASCDGGQHRQALHR